MFDIAKEREIMKGTTEQRGTEVTGTTCKQGTMEDERRVTLAAKEEAWRVGSKADALQ